MLDDDRRLDCQYCSATQQQGLRLRGNRDVKGEGVWVWVSTVDNVVAVRQRRV
jgi:hypothetical protein